MWYWIFRIAFKAFFKVFFFFTVEGLENIPQKTNFIVVANHTSFLDPLCIMVAVPKRIYCIASRYLYVSRWLSWFLRKTEAFPTGGSSTKGAQLLMENKTVGLFPEGGCSRDGRLKPFKRGAALLAAQTGRPILPCTILGAYDAFPRKAKFPRLFRPIKVKIGAPVYLLRKFEDIIDDIYLQEGIVRVRNTMEEMLYVE